MGTKKRGTAKKVAGSWKLNADRIEAIKAAAEVQRATNSLRVRKNIRSLSAEELLNLRHAYEGLYEISSKAINDERGYQWIAGVHGYPTPVYCQHGNLNFPTWHRVYIWEFEERLRNIVPSVTLPYWDWTSATTASEGMPKACTDETYYDPTVGKTKPNPLYSAYSQVTRRDTRRDPGPLSDFQQMQALVRTAQGETNYTDYSPALENPHNQLHVWVGGDMGQVPVAAYDPIFWIHHANVDRYWFEWQKQNGNGSVPDDVKRFVCAPFTYTGGDTLNPEGPPWNYTYAEDHAFVAEADLRRPASAKKGAAFKVALGKVKPGARRYLLQFHGLLHTKGSYEVRFFIQGAKGRARSVSARTGRSKAAGYAASLHLFGHGECGGAVGHCAVPKERWPDPLRRGVQHHLTPYNQRLDVTDAVRRAGDGPLTLSYVVVDRTGTYDGDKEFRFQGMSLVGET